MRTLLFLLAFTLPMDWFEPTGSILRELGAKPAILVCILISVLIYAEHLISRRAIYIPPIAYTFAIVLALGFFGFFITILLLAYGGDYGSARSNISQFVNHSLLLGLFVLCIPPLTAVFSSRQVREDFIRYLILSLYVYLLVFYLEYFGILNDDRGLLSLFRAGYLDAHIVTAFFSEPSYYGAYAALLLPIAAMAIKRRIIRVITIFLLIVSIYLSGGKTFYLIIFFQVFLSYLYLLNAKWKFWALIPIAALLLGITILVWSLGVFNFSQNLSSVMRFGSSHLAINVALSGHGVLGIGTGQFHFFYTPEFAPHYLHYSVEAQNQFYDGWESRASTFNYFVRILVECGIIAIIILSISLSRLLSRVSSVFASHNLYGFIMTGSAIAFLLTQDTYFYPPLLVGVAWLSLIKAVRK